MSYILETRGLTHVYGAGTPFERKALDAVDIAIRKGEIIKKVPQAELVDALMAEIAAY